MQSALEYVLGAGNVSVVAVDIGPNRYTWQITFQGSLASQDLPQSTTNVSAIYLTSGSTATPADSTITNGGTSGAADEVQQVAITGAVGGTFTLSYGGQTTAPLAYNATASDVQSGLHLSSLGEGGVSVSGPAGGPWVITFQGTLADQDVPQITADGSGLVGTTQITTSISPPADHDKTVVATLSSSSGYVLDSVASDTVTIAENDNHAPTALTIQYTAPTGAEFSRTAESGVLYGAADPAGGPLSAVLLEGVSHGMLTLNADGSFDYTPDNGYGGTDSFVFQAFDGVYYSLPSVVTLNIVPPPAPALAVLDSSGNSIANSTGSDSLADAVVGSPSSTTVTIKNTGTAALTLDPASLVVPSGFTVVMPFASPVAPGSSTTLVIQLDAAVAGQYSGAVHFADNDPANGAFAFAISGTVHLPAPQIKVSAGADSLANGSSFAFPERGVGEPTSQTFTITNSGSADLTLDTGSISLPGGYRRVTPFAPSVAPGDSTTLVIELIAQTAGQYDGNLQFTDDDASTGTFVVALAGNVVVSPMLLAFDATTPIVDSGSVSLGTGLLGSPLTMTFILANAGGADLMLDPGHVTLPSGYTVVSPFAATVAPGASTSMTLAIDGYMAGDFQGDE